MISHIVESSMLFIFVCTAHSVKFICSLTVSTDKYLSNLMVYFGRYYQFKFYFEIYFKIDGYCADNYRHCAVMIVISMSCREDAISKSFSLSFVSDILFHFCNVLRGLIGTKVLLWVSYLWMNCCLIAPQTELGQYDFSQVHAWMITALCPTDFLQLATDSVTLLVE